MRTGDNRDEIKNNISLILYYLQVQFFKHALLEFEDTPTAHSLQLRAFLFHKGLRKRDDLN